MKKIPRKVNGESLLKWLTGLLYAAIIAVLSVMFFTNDFGLVDLRKTSVIIGVGIDVQGDEIELTAQLAVPQPAENGDNTQFTVVTGKGKTVACALNEINVKTGFYPKLVFCKLVLLGESCLAENTNTVLNYFYSNEYTGLTAKLAACQGEAGEMLSMDLPFGDSTTDSIERLLSEEAQKSGNVSTTDLNKFGQGHFTKSRVSFMPYIQTNSEGGSSGGNPENGDSQQGGGEQSQSQGAGGGTSGGEEPVEFLCNSTAVFEDGYFRGVLGEDEAFALNILTSDVRHTYTECGEDDDRTVLGLRSCKGGVDLKVENGVPVLTLSFSASAKRVDDATDETWKTEGEGSTPPNALKEGEKAITKQLDKLFTFCKENDCDVLGAKNLLYKYNTKYYDTFKDILYDKISVVYAVKLRSAS